jgi:hypothetical protein
MCFWLLENQRKDFGDRAVLLTFEAGIHYQLDPINYFWVHGEGLIWLISWP